MIGKTSRSSSFRKVVAYGTSKSEDAQLIYTQNLPKDVDGEILAAKMALTASRSGSKAPAEHIIVSWDKRDMVGADAMVYVAKRLLDKLGLSEHQVVVGEHKDTDKPHMHIIVNRVHPRHGEIGEDGKPIYVWDPKGYWQDIERELRDMEREFGWRQVEGRNALQMGHEAPDRTGSSQKEYHSRERRGVPQKKKGRSWEDSHERLHSHGSSGAFGDDLPRTKRQLLGVWRAAEFGDAECQWKMSRIYQFGIGVAYSDDIAAGWAQMAARQGHAKAIEVLKDLRTWGAKPTLPPLPSGDSERKYVGIGGFRRGKRPKDWIGEWAGERIGGVDLG